MSHFLYELLLMSASGTVMFLMATLFYKQTKSKYARWYYALIITALLMLILPFRAVFGLPNAVTVKVPQSISIPSAAAVNTEARGFDFSYAIFAVWAAGALAVILFNVYSYVKTRKILLNISAVSEDERADSALNEAKELLNVRVGIRVRKSETLRSPLLFGIVSPTVILPDAYFSQSELRMIFTHELTHYKHKDLIVKLLAILASSLHWFNPCVYIMKKAVNSGCELCCDETVLSVLKLPDKKQYGRLLISIMENPGGGFAYTTAMSAKQSLRERLLKIVEFKAMPLPVKMVCAMLALSMTVCSVTVFGFDVVKENLPEEISQVIASTPKPRPIKTEEPEEAAEPHTNEEEPPREITMTQKRAETPREQTAQQINESYEEPSYIYETEEDIEAVNQITEPVIEEESAVRDADDKNNNVDDVKMGVERDGVYNKMGEPDSVSSDGSKETYELSDGSTAVLQYDGEVLDRGYIVVQ